MKSLFPDDLASDLTTPCSTAKLRQCHAALQHQSPYLTRQSMTQDFIIIKNYKSSSQSWATAAFQRDATKMSKKGYSPVSQVWTQDAWGCGSFLFALLLCVVAIGIIVFIYMLIVKPSGGTLTVTYQLRSR